jgi:hypothetical protein
MTGLGYKGFEEGNRIVRLIGSYSAREVRQHDGSEPMDVLGTPMKRGATRINRTTYVRIVGLSGKEVKM